MLRRYALGIACMLGGSFSSEAALYAEYKFEQSSYNGTASEVLDTSGNGRHGKITGSVTSTASGKICRGIQIAANTTAGTIDAFDTGIDVNSVGNAGAISFWYKSVDASSSAHRAIFDATTVSGQQFYLYRDDQGTSIDLNFVINDANGTRTDAGETNVMSEATWTHIAVTWAVAGSGSHMKLYVNGVEKYDESFDGHGGLHTGIGTLYFGDNRNAVAPEPVSANGYIDQIRIYNHTLSAAEVVTDRDASPSCQTLHHLEVTSAAGSATIESGTTATLTVKACQDALSPCTAYTGGAVTGTLAITGTNLTTVNQAFTITSGNSTTTVAPTFTTTATTTASIALSSPSPTPVGSPTLWCGTGGTTPTSATSCGSTAVQRLHHVELTTTTNTVASGGTVTISIKSCADGSTPCTAYTAGAVTGTLSITGTNFTTVTPGFTITAGSSTTSTAPTFTASAATTATMVMSASTPATAPTTLVEWCGLNNAAASSGGSCAFTVSLPTGPDHIEVTTTSATGLTCAAASFVIKACANASAPCSSLYTGGGITGNLVLTGTGGSTTAFSIDATGTTTKSVNITKVGSVTAGVSAVSPAATGTPALTCGIGGAVPSSGGCSTAYTTATSMLSFDVPNHVSYDSQSVTISAVKSSSDNTACVPAFSGTKTVTFTCAFNNPATGTKPVVVGGTSATCGGAGSGVSLAFNGSGQATTTVRYADVGQVTLTGTYSGTAGTDSDVTGSDTFIAKPASFGISGVTAAPIAAGSTFSATITARNSNGDATPNFGRETAVTADYFRLSWTKYRPTGMASVAGTFTGSGMGIAPFIASSSFSSGAVTLSDLKWTEVGSGDLSVAFVPATYLGIATAATGTTGTTGAVGPFVPHHFDASVTQGCGAFTYGGQAFSLTLTARNAANSTTYNYDGTLNTSPNHAKAVTLSMVTGSGSGSLGNGTIAASSFGAGVASTTTPVYTLTNKVTSPTSVQIRGTDSDGVSSSGGTEGAVLVRSGRVKMSNAYGSEKLVLRVPLQAQYWNGRSWVINSADNCTVIPTAAVVRANYLDHRGAGTTSWSTTPSGSMSFLGGNADLVLTAPSPTGSVGSVDIALNLGSAAADQSCLSAHPASTGAGVVWLRAQNGSCATTHDRDPSARITFGIYSPESKRLVFARELY